MASLVDLDHVARAFVVAHRWAPLDGVMLALGVIGYAGAVFAAAALCLSIARRRAHDIVQVGLALLLAWIVSDRVIKPAVGRPRPFVATPAVRVIGPHPHGASFPSGHATSAFAAAATLARLAPGGAPAWWVLAAAIAYSRVYVGVHYPGDVLAGALLGLLLAPLARTVGDRLPLRRRAP